ncbi:hypothetical protein ACFL0W_01845 [Nanoarchaeota archaeon]
MSRKTKCFNLSWPVLLWWFLLSLPVILTWIVRILIFSSEGIIGHLITSVILIGLFYLLSCFFFVLSKKSKIALVIFVILTVLYYISVLIALFVLYITMGVILGVGNA